MMKCSSLTIAVIAMLLVVTSCADTKYDVKDAMVYRTQHRHWGRGFFKVEVFYRYAEGQDTLAGHSTADGLVSSYASQFNAGDSIRIAVSPLDTSDRKILGRIPTSYREHRGKPSN
jgi:hypothetical protein